MTSLRSMCIALSLQLRKCLQAFAGSRKSTRRVVDLSPSLSIAALIFSKLNPFKKAPLTSQDSRVMPSKTERDTTSRWLNRVAVVLRF